VTQDAAHVHVVRGTPDDVELAALVAGLMAASSAQVHDDTPAHPAAWSDRRRTLRGSDRWASGSDAWRWSLRA